MTGNSTVGYVSCTQVNSTGQISNGSGGLSIVGTSSVTGSLTATTLTTGGTATILGSATVGGTLTVTGASTFNGAFAVNTNPSRNLTVIDNYGPLITTNGGATNQMGLSMSGDYTTGSYKDGSTRVWIKLFGGAASNNGTSNIVCNTINGGVQLTQGSTAWAAVSDERLKTVTGTYTNALEDLKVIKAIKFTWNKYPENGPQVGVTAQSAQMVVPEAVSTVTCADDGKEYLGVRYTELVPILIAGLQEATTRIEALEALVQQLLAK